MIVYFFNFLTLCVSTSVGLLMFSSPRGFITSSAQYRSVNMPRMYNNNPPYHYLYQRQPPVNPISYSGLAAMPGLPLTIGTGTTFGQIFPGAFQGHGVIKSQNSRPSPLSPYAKFLSNEQQEVVAELANEARKAGASEPDVHVYLNKYVKEILPAEQYANFQQYNVEFEEIRKRGKRDVVQEIHGIRKSKKIGSKKSSKKQISSTRTKRV